MSGLLQSIVAACRNIEPMQIAFIIMATVMLIITIRMIRDPEFKKFRLIYMVCSKEGYPDNMKMYELGAFFVTTYGFLWILWDHKMSEFYVVTYGSIWVVRGAYAMKTRAESARTTTVTEPAADPDTPKKVTVTEPAAPLPNGAPVDVNIVGGAGVDKEPLKVTSKRKATKK